MNKHFSIRTMAYQGLFAACIAICAWISIPFGEISFTMQTFALFLALFTLGGKGGTPAVLAYLLMGAVGFPVFSGFHGGLGILLGVTGGYLWGMAFAAFAYWLITFFFGKKAKLLAALLGLTVCYLCGTVWFIHISGVDAGWWFAVLKCVAPFVLPDVLKIILAYGLSRRIRLS